MNSKDDYIRKLQATLAEFNSEIDSLSVKAGKVTSDIKYEYHEQIDVLKAKQAIAKTKLDELQNAGGHAWQDMKSGADLAWQAIGEALDSARKRFK